LHAHVYTVNEGIRTVVCTCINSEWEIRIVECTCIHSAHSLSIHVNTTMRIPPFTVYTCTCNYADSPIHCLYMYMQLYRFPHSLFIYVHTIIRIPHSLCIHVHATIRIVVCTYINSEWGYPYSCMYMYKQ
jgi:hypothetical protein